MITKIYQNFKIAENQSTAECTYHIQNPNQNISTETRITPHFPSNFQAYEMQVTLNNHTETVHISQNLPSKNDCHYFDDIIASGQFSILIIPKDNQIIVGNLPPQSECRVTIKMIFRLYSYGQIDILAIPYDFTLNWTKVFTRVYIQNPSIIHTRNNSRVFSNGQIFRLNGPLRLEFINKKNQINRYVLSQKNQFIIYDRNNTSANSLTNYIFFLQNINKNMFDIPENQEFKLNNLIFDRVKSFIKSKKIKNYKIFKYEDYNSSEIQPTTQSRNHSKNGNFHEGKSLHQVKMTQHKEEITQDLNIIRRPDTLKAAFESYFFIHAKNTNQKNSVIIIGSNFGQEKLAHFEQTQLFLIDCLGFGNSQLFAEMNDAIFLNSVSMNHLDDVFGFIFSYCNNQFDITRENIPFVRSLKNPTNMFTMNVPYSPLDMTPTKIQNEKSYFEYGLNTNKTIDFQNSENKIVYHDESKVALPTEELPTKELPTKELPTEDLPTENLPTKELPTEELPAEELPAEELPTEELPAEELTKNKQESTQIEYLQNDSKFNSKNNLKRDTKQNGPRLNDMEHIDSNDAIKYNLKDCDLSIEWSIKNLILGCDLYFNQIILLLFSSFQKATNHDIRLLDFNFPDMHFLDKFHLILSFQGTPHNLLSIEPSSQEKKGFMRVIHWWKNEKIVQFLLQECDFNVNLNSMNQIIDIIKKIGKKLDLSQDIFSIIEIAKAEKDVYKDAYKSNNLGKYLKQFLKHSAYLYSSIIEHIKNNFPQYQEIVELETLTKHMEILRLSTLFQPINYSKQVIQKIMYILNQIHQNRKDLEVNRDSKCLVDLFSTADQYQKGKDTLINIFDANQTDNSSNHEVLSNEIENENYSFISIVNDKYRRLYTKFYQKDNENEQRKELEEISFEAPSNFVLLGNLTSNQLNSTLNIKDLVAQKNEIDATESLMKILELLLSYPNISIKEDNTNSFDEKESKDVVAQEIDETFMTAKSDIDCNCENISSFESRISVSI
ncbi:hypothetical protein TRFO_08025 [Tritrichomonas foetus]|uniref:Uncharacterized protein n=1 Tax=Tritrichomonas foetus TaxID=1144522 RepID=A0A1J4JML1_9EUKA|nr:hypothetical protein TRFO_08025 [Tritrichomonas foetus]|eukprot:OHT00351.1 hypothetical protein TRFO_08025 [Tritrichomonas foetus]